MAAVGTVAPLYRWPRTNDELWWWVYGTWGIKIPRKKVCHDHCAPFTAFAEAYFGREPVTIWKASRGLGGKSRTLSCLGNTEIVTLGCKTRILGGSSAQSLNVHEASKEAWAHPNAPAHFLAKEPTIYTTHLNNGAEMIALTASQKSVRGPHPQRLRLDEIDEMELAILDAAMGMPMDAKNRAGDMILSQTVMSSTHQYPDKTMFEMLKRSKENSWPVRVWCYRENLFTPDNPTGWLTESLLERKKKEVSKRMWDTEFELQEPSFEGRAIDTDHVERAFNEDLGAFPGDAEVELTFEEPKRGSKYVTGVDWAKEKDWTVISTWIADRRQWRRVAWSRHGRRPWPQMIKKLDDRLSRYGGEVAHDATGIGNVIDDLIDYDKNKVEPVVLVGRRREDILNDYVAGIEGDHMVGPKIEYVYGEHKYATNDDLFGRGHLPDTIAADALAWSMRDQSVEIGTGFGGVNDEFVKDGNAWAVS